MKEMELHNLLETVHDEDSFLNFAKALLKEINEDLEFEKRTPKNSFDSTHNGWENITLGAYFDSAIAWADASDFGKSQGISDNLWNKFATFLYCGKIYE
ncbi:hypothetical protein V6Z05_19925 [Leptospira venezuelensis]|uniref:hypothetical protein n=1 Tax=Leptospira venezuelensis TaxID=1958811 RepID=UPI0018F87EB2|nr:hypothetical protein [Leptospira venezuelensis]